MYILYYIIYYIMIHVGYCDYHCQSINNDNMNIIYYHLFCNFLLSTSDSVFVSMNSTDSQKLYESLILRSHPVVVRGCVLLPWKMTDCFIYFHPSIGHLPIYFSPTSKSLPPTEQISCHVFTFKQAIIPTPVTFHFMNYIIII